MGKTQLGQGDGRIQPTNETRVHGGAGWLVTYFFEAPTIDFQRPLFLVPAANRQFQMTLLILQLSGNNSLRR